MVQFGVRKKLIVKRVEGKGWGLFTAEVLEQGDFVCSYLGELLSSNEARTRLAKRSTETDNENNYLLVLREQAQSGQIVYLTCIDPTKIGNVGRFLNHSCEPNLGVWAVRVDEIVPFVAFFARRRIESGQELSWDYGALLTGKRNVDLVKGPKAKQCLCGSSKCWGRLPNLAAFADDRA